MSENEPGVSCQSTKHWGEFLESHIGNGHLLPDVSEDIKKSMQKNCLDQYPDDDNLMQIKDINLPPLNPFIMYAIQLHKWMNNMMETIGLAEMATENNLIPAEDAKMPIPEMPDITLKHIQNNLNFMPSKSPTETVQVELEIPELSEAVVKKILSKCVAVMMAHIGFEDSFQSVVDVLIDVLEQFLIKVCDRFVSALNEEETLDTCGFPNVLERVLEEIGSGGAKGLHNYYQCRVVKYIGVLQKRCQQLEQHYSSLIVPKTGSPTGEFGKWTGVRVKKENTMDVDPETEFGEDLITSGYQLIRNLQSSDDLKIRDIAEGRPKSDQTGFTNN